MDYYRFDPEQAGGGNHVPTVDKVLFRESGDPGPGNAGQGFLIDNIGLKAKKCKKHKKHHQRQLRRCKKKHKKHH